MLALLLLAGCGAEHPRFVAVDGSAIDPFPGPADKAVVWIFVATDCPIANAYAPEIEAIGREYSARGVRLLVVYVDPTIGTEALAAHAADHRYTCPLVADREHVLVRRAGATTTPEAFVFDGRGELNYRGRIDDQYPELGVRRPQATTHELRDALDAVVAGRAVAVGRTEPVGCAIEALAGR